MSAKRVPPADARITLRMTANFKARIQRLANKDNRNLNNWIENCLLQAVKKAEDK